MPALPCPNLKQLDLERCYFRLSERFDSILHDCTGLTHLRLERCLLAEQQPSIAALSTLTKLQHVELNLVEHYGLDVPSTLLLSLTKLTHLGFGLDREDAKAWLQHLSSLTDLQQLSIYQQGSRATCSPSTTPGLSRLTALTSLRLECVTLDPALLRDISTQLQSFHIDQVDLVTDGPHAHAAAAPSGAAAQLLSCIAGMTRLQQLCLGPLPYFPAEAAAYTALTASSNLQQLQLSDNGWPDGIWQAMFTAGRTWPHLQVCTRPTRL